MSSVSTCPDLQELATFLLGQLTAEEAEQRAQHLRKCGNCLATVQALKGGGTLPGGKRLARSPLPAEAADQVVQRLLDEVNGVPVDPGNPTRTAAPLGTPERVPLPPPDRLVPLAPPVPPPAAAGPPLPYSFLGPPEEPGELGRLGPYRVLAALGAGGMGIVFKAEDLQLRRAVALKVMQPNFGASVEARQRFLREARAVAAIEHEHIVTVYQVGEDRGLPYLAMQFLKGQTLEDRLKRDKQIPVADVLHIGRDIAEGLAAAHAAGLIHRDIKPANIWLETLPGEPGGSSPRTRVKILDFGLARAVEDTHLTRTGTVIGTPEYMSPEQAHGKAVDSRSDLFSLGCVLYDMCAGQSPFQAKETMSVLLALTTQTPRALTELNPKVPQKLVILIMRLLGKHPDDRPASAALVADVLRDLQRQREEGSSPAARYDGRKSSWSSAGVIAAVLLASLAFGGFWFRADVIRLVKNVMARMRSERAGPRS